MVGPKFLSVLLLVLGVGDCEDLCTKSVCPHKREVAESSNPDDTDLLARTTSKTNERRVSCQPSTQHRGRDGGIKVLRNFEHEIFLYSNVRREASLRDSAILVLGTVSVDPEMIGHFPGGKRITIILTG